VALNVSFFASVTETRPDPRFALSWEQLLGLLGPPRAYTAKEAAPLYSPAEWLSGHTRGKAGIVCVHFGVLDLDHWTSDAVGELIGRLMSRGLAYFIASTWSHGEKGPEDICARLLMPFSRPVLPSEWPRFWSALDEEITNGRADPKCKDISRSYFFPSFCQGGFEPFSDSASGAPVDVDAILARVGGAVRGGIEDDRPQGTADGGTDVSRDELKALGRKLAGSTNTNKASVGNAILRMCKGEAYAKEPNTPGPLPEGRNDTTFRMVATICEHFPFAAPEKLAAQFAASVQEMQEPSLEQIESMITRQQAGARSAHATLIQEALGRNEPYTDTELQTYADMLDISRARMKRRWIVQRDRSYYIFKAGTYECFAESEVSNAAMTALAPAISAGVDTQKITQQGVKQKTAEDLVRDYGTIAKAVEVDLTAQFARFDESRAVMIEAPTPLRVKARRHEDVAAFLKIFGGQMHGRLLQWIAVLPALSEPCAALYLEGRGGSGKSMLANGLCRIWSPNLTTLSEVIGGQFNESLQRCPLVFGDERAPVDQRGRVRTDDLREFIQARARPFARKFKPNAIITGCVRVILAANNRNLIETSEHLTPEDIDAIVSRIFYLRVPDEAVAYLKALPEGTTNRWVYDNALAEHALHLAETITVPRTNRFLVAGESSDLSRALTVTTGLRGRVCEWITNFLLDPKKLRVMPKLAPLVRVSKGRLLVNVKAVTDSWLEYVRPTKDGVPDPMSVAKALGGLSTPITLRLDTGNVAFRNVHLDLIMAWGEESGYATRESIEVSMAALENEFAAAERKAMS